MNAQTMADRNAPMNRQQQLALRLATFPMVAGLVALCGWFVTEAQPLMFIGYGCLVLGVVIALFVPFLLLRAFTQAPNVRNTVMISVLAVLNLPVTFVAALEGISRATRYRVTLQNEAESPWQGVTLTNQGVISPGATIAAKSTEVRDVWFLGEGSFELHFEQNGKVEVCVIEGYVEKRQGGAATVVRAADGTVRVVPE